MKIRSGFVSNSSSSSFVVSLRNLTLMQFNQIVNHQKVGAKLGIEYAKSDPWDITVGKGILSGSTSMDNFDMEKFLEKIGVTGVNWGKDEWDEQPLVEESESCNDVCEQCQMRFICYTNKWREDEEK